MYRGSRKHVLDWTGQPDFFDELIRMVAPVDVVIGPKGRCMPLGEGNPLEARLDRLSSEWLSLEDRTQIQTWWLKHLRGANTPNWDIAVGCLIEGKPGLILVEAKANWPELGLGGKPEPKGKKQPDGSRASPSQKSLENHDQIAQAIAFASAGWQAIDPRISLPSDSHYQLANRLAFTWKLASLGIPVILVYLGFTGDEGISDAGQPFADDFDWQKAFNAYAGKAFPSDQLDRRLQVGSVPVWVMSRSKVVLEQSPRLHAH